MRNKLLTILFVSIFLFSLVSAVNPKFEKDNIKSIDSTTNYGRYTIEENKWWDVLKLWQPEKIKEIELKNNTDKCTNCLAEGKIILYKDDVLIEDILFKRSYDNQNWIDWNGFINWKLYVENKNRYEEVEITELDCDNENKSCKEVKKKITLDNGEWIKLELGKVYPIGTYKWKLEGSKKPSTILDWVIKTNGELLTEWAVWGNISEGDDAEVVLNSPADSSTQYTNSVITNATATITGGAYLVNASLYDNSTGSWEIRDSNSLSGNILPYDSWTADLKVDLKNYFKLDEITGTNVVDANKFGNGTASTSDIFTSKVDGVINTGADFSSGTASINLGDIAWIDSTNELTISTWVKWTDLSTRQSIAVKSDGTVPDDLVFVMELINSGYFKFETRDASDVSERIRISPTTWFTTGTYYHIVGVLNATHISLYINGNLANSTTRSGSGNFNPNSNAFTIGRYGSYYGYYGLYDLDEFAIWERGISGAEVKRISFSGTNTSTTTSTNSYPVGSYLWNMQFCDSDGDCGFAEDNRTFIVDSSLPVINMSYPTTLINYGKLNGTLQLNFTATDTNLDDVWYDYNGVNTTITGATSGVYNISNIALTTQKNVTIYANDTAGNLASKTFSWNYKVFETGQDFSESSRAGSVENYGLNITLGSGINLLTGTLVYLDEERVASIYSSGSNRRLLVENFETPLYSVDTNVSFYWFLELVGENISIQNETQLIEAVLIDNCSVHTYNIFNLSLFDEITKQRINGDIEINFQLLNKPNYNLINNISLNLENINQTSICSGINLSNENVVYSAEIKYVSDGYVPELYHIQRAEINDESQQLNLYSLNENKSTEFKITYQDSSYKFVEGAVVQLQRKYISEGIYRIVEAPITSNEGTAVVHIDLDSNKYQVTIVKNGEVLDIFENLVFKCDSILTGECNQKLLGNIDPQNNINLDKILDFAYTDPVRVNETFSFSFSIPSGSPSSIMISLVQKDQFGNTTLCNQTIVSSAGSLECDFSKTIGESYVELEITKNGDLMLQSTYIIPEEGGLNFLGNNFFIVLLLLLSVVGMAFTSPEWIIVNGVVTFVIAGSLWLLSGLSFVVGLGSLMWLVVASGILIFKLAKQEDR